MPSSVAERVRIHRKRRRDGLRLVHVLITEDEINRFIVQGYLEADGRNLTSAIQEAIREFIFDRLP
jgi:hypothetical protein